MIWKKVSISIGFQVITTCLCESSVFSVDSIISSTSTVTRLDADSSVGLGVGDIDIFSLPSTSTIVVSGTSVAEVVLVSSHPHGSVQYSCNSPNSSSKVVFTTE